MQLPISCLSISSGSTNPTNKYLPDLSIFIMAQFGKYDDIKVPESQVPVYSDFTCL